jgi:hypothetical protein
LIGAMYKHSNVFSIRVLITRSAYTKNLRASDPEAK